LILSASSLAAALASCLNLSASSSSYLVCLPLLCLGTSSSSELLLEWSSRESFLCLAFLIYLSTFTLPALTAKSSSKPVFFFWIFILACSSSCLAFSFFWFSTCFLASWAAFSFLSLSSLSVSCCTFNFLSCFFYWARATASAAFFYFSDSWFSAAAAFFFPLPSPPFLAFLTTTTGSSSTDSSSSTSFSMILSYFFSFLEWWLLDFWVSVLSNHVSFSSS